MAWRKAQQRCRNSFTYGRSGNGHAGEALCLCEIAGSLTGLELLSGNPENVNFALTKLGQYVEEPDSHTNILIVGNDSTGLWKKAFALAEWNELVKVLESVINDGV